MYVHRRPANIRRLSAMLIGQDAHFLRADTAALWYELRGKLPFTFPVPLPDVGNAARKIGPKEFKPSHPGVEMLRWVERELIARSRGRKLTGTTEEEPDEDL